MPWKPGDAKRFTKKARTPKRRRQWSAVADNILAATDEGVYYSSDDGATWHQANIPAEDIEDIAASGDIAYAIVCRVQVSLIKKCSHEKCARFGIISEHLPICWI